MERGYIESLGKFLNASHESLRDLYEVTGRELDCLFKLANNRDECIGLKMTGVGLSGSTISIVRKGFEKDFSSYIIKEYKKEIGYPPSVYEAGIDDGITAEKI